MTIPDYCTLRQNAIADRMKTIGTRLELQTTPYNGSVTQDQLNMRRKVEILKYNPTQTNTQTNARTQKEVFSQIMRGSYKQCQRDTRSNPVSTTASDVPGKPMYLYEDSNIPLYNYKKQVTFGISQVYQPPKT